MRTDKLKRGDKVRCVLTASDFDKHYRNATHDSVPPAEGIVMSMGSTIRNKPVLSVKITKAGYGVLASIDGDPNAALITLSEEGLILVAGPESKWKNLQPGRNTQPTELLDELEEMMTNNAWNDFPRVYES